MFDVAVNQWFQSFSSPALDRFFLYFTELGSHYAYMLILPFIYWAVDRRIGRHVAGVLLASMWFNGLIKEYLTTPRPDPSLVRVLGDEPSPGFPSGHAQGAMTLWGFLALAVRRRWLTVLAVAIIVGISISRLYLGLHYFGDVLGGLLIGAVFVLVGLALSARQSSGAGRIGLRLALLFWIPLLLYPIYQTGTSELLIGVFIGFFTADALAGSLVPFQERVPLPQQLAKLVIGYVVFAALVAVHLLYLPVGLPSVFGYSLIGAWIAWGAPSVFRALNLDGAPRLPRVEPQTRRIARRYLAAATLVLVLVAGSTIYIRQAVPVASQPVIARPTHGALNVGHRGGAGIAPENTVVSLATALLYGAEMLEFDVHLTADGQLVVMHDETVDRTTNGTGRIGEMTLQEIQALDAGYSFTPDGGATYPWRGAGVSAPTLAQVLGAFPDTPLLIELKSADPEIADATVALIDAVGAQDRVIVSSFHDQVIKRVREIAPEMTTGYSEAEALRFVILQRLGLAQFVKPVAPTMQLPEWHGPLRVINPGLLRVLRRQGIELYAWTINDEETMERLLSLGVNGIITDYPDRLQRVLEAQARRRSEQLFY